MNDSLRYLLFKNSFVFAFLAMLTWVDILLVTATLFGQSSLDMFWVIISWISIALVTISVVLVAWNLKGVYRVLSDPVLSLLGKEVAKQSDNHVVRIVEELAHKEEIETPRIVTIASPLVGSFGFSPDNALIFIGKEIIESLGDKELKSVLLHEIFHIKSDLSYSTSFLVFKDIFLRPVNVAFISVVGFVFAGVRIVIVFPSFPQDLFVPLFLIPAVVVLIAFVVFVLYRSSIIMRPGSLSSTRHLFYREFLADAYAAISLGETQPLRGAIVKIARLNLKSQVESHLLSFVKASTLGNFSESQFSPSLGRSITEAISTLSKPNASMKEIEDTLLANRVGIIDLVTKLLEGNMNVEVHRQSNFRLTRTMLSVTPEAMAYVLSSYRKTFSRVMDRLARTERINLISEAASLGIKPFDLFVILFFLSISGILRFNITADSRANAI